MDSEKRVICTMAFVGICHMQVCAARDATDEEILSVCNAENPSGTRNGWSRVIREAGKDGFWNEPGPVACAEDSSRLHMLVSC